MVPPTSDQVSRVWPYSGSCSALKVVAYMALTFFGVLSHTLQLTVWPLPRSLATTSGISVDFSSSPYLDVSVQAVPHIYLFDSAYVTWT